MFSIVRNVPTCAKTTDVGRTFSRYLNHFLKENVAGYKHCRRQYSYRDRKFHVNILRYAFESIDVCIRTAAINREQPELYRPTLVHRTTHFVFKDNDIPLGPGEEAGPYLQKTLALLPAHLHKRFSMMVSMFSVCVGKARLVERRAKTQRSVNAPRFANEGVGSLRMVERLVRYGGDDINIVLLMEQTKDLPTYYGNTVLEADRAADEFTRRSATDKSHFDIVGSFVYTWSGIFSRNIMFQVLTHICSARRSNKQISWDEAGFQPPELLPVRLSY